MSGGLVGTSWLSRELTSAICPDSASQPHGDETVGIEIGLEKFSRRSFGTEQGFGGEVTAADGAFHGGGPAGVGPIAGEKKAGDGGLLLGTPAIDSGLRRKCCGGFLYGGGLHQIWLTPAGPGVGDVL